MGAAQGLFQFAGAQALFSGSFTLATGISPSVCTLNVAPGSSSLRIGPLVLSYGGVRMTWRDCIVDKVESTVGEDGFVMWSVVILDRRWKWRGLGQISGNYNTRVGGTIDDTTRKSARRLIEMCLDAMGERDYNTSEVPTDIFPEIEWDYDPPAEAMAKICDDLGLVVVLDISDSVRIMRKGSGPSLPNIPSVTSYEQLVDPPELPSRVVVVGGPSRHSGWFQLEAVGLEESGEIKPIDDLFYRPAGGWSTVDLRTFYQVEERYRPLAQQSVFRMYRIKTPIAVPGVKGLIQDLNQILPTDPDTIERVMEDTKKPTRIYAKVRGVFYNGLDDFGVWSEDEGKPKSDEVGRSVTPDNFDIDTEKGIVKFSDAMYQLRVGTARPGGQGVYPATLTLNVACSFRDSETRALTRTEFDGGRGIGTDTAKKDPTARYVLRDDLVLAFWEEFDFEKGRFVQKNNIKTIAPLAAAIKKQIEAEYKTQSPVAASYDGIVPISPSGAVPSVTWSIGEDGRASTRASANFEDLRQPVPSRSESRFAERARAENAKKRNARLEREKARRGR